ncbi:MAG: META domain-containing protein [Chloroflexota bacterium]|nr:META domain-containing protein [Chloroflexota bacterium]
MTIFARILLLLPIVMAGCSPAASTSLDGRAFLSTAVTINGQAHDLVPGTRIRITFSDGQLGASAGCNMLGGTYTFADGQLLVSDLSTTEMGCDPDRHAQDEWLSAFLGSRPMVTLNGNNLELASPGAAISLLDREVADPDLPLVGPTWTVESIISGDAVSSVSLLATIAFQADGRVTLNTSCNSGGGQYVATGDTLRFSDLVTTKRDCEAPAGDVETAILRVLQAETVSYRIEAGSLTLNAGGFGLQLTGR